MHLYIRAQGGHSHVARALVKGNRDMKYTVERVAPYVFALKGLKPPQVIDLLENPEIAKAESLSPEDQARLSAAQLLMTNTPLRADVEAMQDAITRKAGGSYRSKRKLVEEVMPYGTKFTTPDLGWLASGSAEPITAMPPGEAPEAGMWSQIEALRKALLSQDAAHANPATRIGIS